MAGPRGQGHLDPDGADEEADHQQGQQQAVGRDRAGQGQGRPEEKEQGPAPMTDPIKRGAKSAPARQRIYLRACALRREIAFANPLLDFDSILFVVRGVIHGPDELNRDWFGQHQSTQFFAFNSVAGGGIYAIRNWKREKPESKKA